MNINDIYFCKDNKCPICGEELIGSITDYIECKSNRCYTMNRFDDWEDKVWVFDELFIVHLGMRGPHGSNVKRVVDKINYWKENDRYVAKILEGR